MTVYPTTPPDVLNFDKYRYNSDIAAATPMPGEPKFPVAGVTYGFPSGTGSNDVILLAMTYGTGSSPPAVFRVGGTYDGDRIGTGFAVGPGGRTFRAGSGSSIAFTWFPLHGDTGVFVQFRTFATDIPVDSPAIIWVIRLDGTDNPPEDATYAGPRYQHYGEGSGNGASAANQTLVIPPIDNLENTFDWEVPGGVPQVQGTFFAGYAASNYNMGDTAYDPIDYELYSVGTPAAPSGWTKLDEGVYYTGSYVVQDSAIYWKQANSASETFPSTSLHADTEGWAGVGMDVHFLDYDYNAGSYVGMTAS